MKAVVRIAVGMALTTAALYGGDATSAAGAPVIDPCATGDALLHKHLLDEAGAFYRVVLKDDSTLACAKLGRTAVTGERAYVTAKLAQGEAARAAADELRAKAGAAKQRAGKLKGPARDQQTQVADVLDRSLAVEDRAANAAYASARAHDAHAVIPKPAKVPRASNGLVARVGDWIKGAGNWVEREGKQAKKVVIDRADDAGQLAATIAALLLAITVLVMLVLRFLLLSRRFGRWVHHVPILRRVTHRPLVVGDVKGEKIDLALQLRDALGTASAPLGQGVDLATGTDSADTLLGGVDGALAKLPQARLLTGAWQLLRLLVSLAPLKVEGAVLPQEARGYGVSLTVARGRHVIATTTLWQESYQVSPIAADVDTTDPPWQRLSIASAAWAQYVWLERLGGRQLTKSLGTADWQSFAYLQVGRDVVTNDANRDLAQMLFARAVDRDPDNLDALFNLAVTDRRRDEPSQAIERLLRLAERTDPEARPGTMQPTDPRTRLRLGHAAFDRKLLWYQAAYNLTAAYVQRYLPDYKPGEPATGADFEAAMGWGRLVVRDVELALRWYDATPNARRRATRRHREAELVAVEGPAVSLLAGLYSMGARIKPSVGDNDMAELDRDAVIDQTEQPAYSSPDPLVEDFLRKDPRRNSYRARYNLACYYSRAATMASAETEDAREGLLQRALDELAYAVETCDLIDLATEDIALKQLRDLKTSQFWKALGRAAPAEVPGVLGEV